MKSIGKMSIFLAIYSVVAAIILYLQVPILSSVAFYSIFIVLMVVNKKESILRKLTVGEPGRAGIVAIIVSMVIVMLVMVIPMDLAPFWNGKIPMHRNQYELLADSILDGHLYIDYNDVEEELLKMENPYDRQERLNLGLDIHYDHAYYNGHFYMYFGVVPVFFLFIPFKLILGKTLVTFHATQFFMLFSVMAFFILLYLIAKKFFESMEVGTYILVTSAVCFITMGYITQAPALYCTAICGGIFFMLWSLCFYFYAVYYAREEWKQVFMACLGALCGALAFGCRPPVALGNLIAIPLAITYAKENKEKHLVRNFILIALPYVCVAALLMTYNYVRFENPFEFGQAYQLTSSDQTIYMNLWDRIDPFYFVESLFNNFFTIGTVEMKFPFFYYGGFFVTYPLMWLIVIFYSKDHVHAEMRRQKTWGLTLFLLLEPVIVTIADVIWSPGLCERYRLDAYYIVGILVFVLIGYRLITAENRDRTTAVVTAFASLSLLMAVLMFLYPNDANYTYAFPEKLDEIRNLLTFGLQ